MLKVAQSKKKLHILSGLDLGTIEKNIINKDLGILDIFGSLVQYNASGKGQHSLPHISYQDKIIYVLGYDNKARWKKALGGQYGCLYIDEINIADMEFVREVSMRCDYLLATLNPDDPSLPIYSEYINHSRPLLQYKSDAPEEINKMLNKEPKPCWVHWFFSFEHNAGLTDEKREQIVNSVPVGTKLYKNKIQGLRGKSTGLVFNFKKPITKKQAKEYQYLIYSCGVDTSYSRNSDDTIAFVFVGITTHRKLIVLKERVYNNKDLDEPLTPSDVAKKLVEFLEECKNDYGFTRNVFIDNADAGTILECQKRKKQTGLSYMFQGSFKKPFIIDRVNLQNGWMASNDFLVVDECKEYIRELNVYSWQETKDMPEDKNDHTINACQYAWLPFRDKIGVIT